MVTVEKALELYGAPVYVRTRSCTTSTSSQTLETNGAIFVEETDEVPEGTTVMFSAHGVAPDVHEEAAAARLPTIDATCPWSPRSTRKPSASRTRTTTSS